MERPDIAEPGRLESRLGFVFFVTCLLFNFWGVHVGWESRNLPGGEFRQAQTALSAYWIREAGDLSLAYPTPVMGKPWSIPMEFPLYQWAVVVTGEVTGWGLTKAGRAVSIGCFYLCLPALYLLLDRWRVARGHRWLVLALVVTCPLYIYYTRAFLIETMALMFSLWFWVGFERAVVDRRRIWLSVAVLAGTGAGLVKVTTFLLYLLPVGAWAIVRLWRGRHATWKIDLAWMGAATALPLAASVWWVHFSDATKLLSPLGRDLSSQNLRGFNLGTTATRFSGDMWLTKLGIVAFDLTWLPVLLLGIGLAVAYGRPRWREIAMCVAGFAAALFFFPALYTYHTYYYVANSILLLLGLGLIVVAMAESKLPRFAVWLVALLLAGGQAWGYLRSYYPGQASITAGGDALTRSLQALTQPNDVIVVLGQDWNSMLPYYAKRRAMMLRNDVAQQPGRVAEALAALDGETIGALVVTGLPDGREDLLAKAAGAGISRQPLYTCGDTAVYVPAVRQEALVQVILDNYFGGIALAPGTELPQSNVINRWCNLADLHRWQRPSFEAMQPKPLRFFSTFGPALDGAGGRWLYGAHPVTRLVFAVTAGQHSLRSTLGIPEDAYRAALAESDASDGVEVSLFALGPGDTRTLLATRLFDPRHNVADRGMEQPLRMDFTLPQAGEVELFFGPGPQNNLTRDWIRLGPLSIQ